MIKSKYPLFRKLKASQTMTVIAFWSECATQAIGCFCSVIGMLILLSVIPHVAIAVIGKLLIETVGARYTEEYSSGFPVGLFFLAPVVSVIAAFTGISGVSYDLGGFVKFLISLGLNVIPGVIATFIYVMTDDNKGAE